MFEFLRKVSAAVTGDLLFRLVYVIEKIILIPVALYEMFRPESLAAKILAGIFSASISLLLLTGWVLTPLSLLGGVLVLAIVNHTIDFGFKGALTGWERGFEGVFEHVVDRFNFIKSKLTGSLYLPPITPIILSRPPNHFTFDDIQQLFNFDADNFQQRTNIVDRINRMYHELHRYNHNQVINQPPAVQPDGDALTPLELSADEFNTLKHNLSRQLSEEERTLLKSCLDDASIKTQADRYLTLWERLDQEDCMILQERPEKVNTIVLVKLQMVNGQERPVPNSSRIFDRESLATWLQDHTTHPETRDEIFHPQQGRYAVHNYYPSLTSTTGVSQELSDLAAGLIPYLEEKKLTPEELRKKHDRAARLRFYAQAADTTVHGTATEQPAFDFK